MLLQEIKELNIALRSLISTKYLQKSIKDNIIKYKEIIFVVHRSTCIKYLDKLRKQQVIDKIVYRKYLLKEALRKLTLVNIVLDRKKQATDKLEHRKKLLQIHQGGWIGLK